VHAHLALADRIAASFHRRYAELVELDDLRQEARLKLVRAGARAQGPRPEPFLQRCIAGALRHHLRDRALLVRLPAKRRDAAPWRHASLDARAPGDLSLRAADPQMGISRSKVDMEQRWGQGALREWVLFRVNGSPQGGSGTAVA
jgi:hypothetical protein